MRRIIVNYLQEMMRFSKECYFFSSFTHFILMFPFLLNNVRLQMIIPSEITCPFSSISYSDCSLIMIFLILPLSFHFSSSLAPS